MAKLCNMCGKEFDALDDQEDFGFHYYVGYGSKHDLEKIEADFCCNCFDRILDWIIPQVKIPIIKGEYGFLCETESEKFDLAILDQPENE